MQTAFVTGATGYTGQEVVRQLCARGVHTVAHVRPDSARADTFAQSFRALGAEVALVPWAAAPMAELLRTTRPDVVFALLGTTQKRAKTAARAGRAPADYQAVDYGLTHMLLTATRESASHARFVYLSSIGVRADTSNEYLRVRHLIEDELSHSGLTWISARPSFITGPDRKDRPAERIYAAIGDGLLSIAGLLGARAVRAAYRSIDAERLARALISLAFDPSAANRVAPASELQLRG